MNKVIIVGAFHEVVELCEDAGFEIVGIVDNIHASEYWGYPILGDDRMIQKHTKDYQDCQIVLSPDSVKVKKKLADNYKSLGFSFATVISPSSHISRSAKIGEGCVIQAGVNVSSNVNIGDFVKINFNSNIMHDAKVGDYSVIAPNAAILGRSSIGKEVYVGANCTILPDANIKDNDIVKPLSIITKDGIE